MIAQLILKPSLDLYLDGGGNMFEQLSHYVFFSCRFFIPQENLCYLILTKVRGDVEGSHPYLWAGVLQADAGLGEQIEHVCVAALRSQVNWSESRPDAP